MPHITTHTVQRYIGPLFADPEARQCLTPQECAQVDEILQKDEYTRRDIRRLSRAVDEVLHHTQEHDHEDE